MAEHERVLGARRAPLLVAAKRCARAVSAALLLAASREAHAQSAPAKPEVVYPPPRVHVFADLTYERAPNAAICPDETLVRFHIHARIGVDSFEKNPNGVYVGRVRVDVSRTAEGFTSSYTWVDTEGATKTKRFTVSGGASRYHCLYALEDVIANLAQHFMFIEMDLGAKLAQQNAPTKACPTTPKARAALPCPPPPTPTDSPYSVWPRESATPAPKEKPVLPDRWPLAVRLGLAVWPELLVPRWGSVGASAELGVRYRFFSVDAELHYDPPIGSFTQPGFGKVTVTRVSGALLLCGHYGWFAGCGVADVGRIFFPRVAFPHVAPLPASTLYATAGVRVGLEFPIAPPRFFLRAAFDLRAPIGMSSYTYKNTTVFEAAGLGVGVGFGFVAELAP